jgi:uncharacterized iron-regulated protein
MQLRRAAWLIFAPFAACVVTPAERLATADVVVLGEHHDSPIVHQAHHQLLADLYSRHPQMMVSMEMFERDVQPLLDKYLAGECDEAAFLAGSRPWPNYAKDYRPVIEFCRTNKLPVIAANVPRPLASKVGKQGLESVVGDPNAARVVSAPDDEYFAAFKQQMSDNPHGKKDEKAKDEKEKDEKAKAEDKAMADDMVRRFYEAQCLKDDTMAESIARALGEAKASGRNPLVVHFCGSFHSDYRRGTVERLQSRMPTARILVVSVEEVPDSDSYIRAADGRIGDYVVVLPESERLAKEQREKAEAEAKKKAAPVAAAGDAANDQGGRPALGLRPDYQFQGKGMRVDAVSEGGAAEAAGLKEGDLITGLDDQEIADLDSYMATLANLTPGKTVVVKLQRDGQEKKIDVKVGTRRQ